MESPHNRASPSPSRAPLASPSSSSPVPSADTSDTGDGAAAAAEAEAEAELPLTMSASVVLADLPRDATAALASVGGFAQEKVVVRFKPVGGAAPALAQDLVKITATRRFEEVVRYLRRKLRCKDTDSVFLYVNSAFAPSLDEVVGNLHQVRFFAADSRRVESSRAPAPRLCDGRVVLLTELRVVLQECV
ncbi:ubiquitin-like autophagy protein Apg12 [Purpureocillium lavendulum]|uniref:Ubiquitin-like protein ATG12 n=1 Tax=Purpureocillium lavendulum TaxID=1247861 RepID=A0AB34FED8_9HYPO|nr:ubiquitin-like autophagy protein Apg12 [Purpureocillium lavendulum]